MNDSVIGKNQKRCNVKTVRNLLVVAAGFVASAPVGAEDLCAAYPTTELFRPRLHKELADPGNWQGLIEGAEDGTEILLADGVYSLPGHSIRVGRSITIRSASGNRDAVVIQGAGFDSPGEGFVILAADVTIADLTITGMRNHGISIKGEYGADGTHVYNVHLFDIGTQHIKGTPGTANGIVACSRIGYSPGGVRGDYINGIDIHGAVDWRIRDNQLYNIWGDGTGCEVDKDCGRYLAGGGPAILLWNRARGNIVERNRIIDCFRGIALGLNGTHEGGAIRNNFVFQSTPSRNGIPGDAGISVVGQGIAIDHNTVVLASDYPGAIEVRDSSGVIIRNNLLDRPIWNRGNSDFVDLGNITDAELRDFERPGSPRLHPRSRAIDHQAAEPVPNIRVDIDGDRRPAGSRPDVGCDESPDSRL